MCARHRAFSVFFGGRSAHFVWFLTTSKLGIWRTFALGAWRRPPAVTRETPYSHRRYDSAASRARDSFQTPSSTHFRRCQMRRSVSKPRSPPRRTRRGLASSEIILIHSSASTLIMYSAAGAAKVTGGGEEAGEEVPKVFGVNRVCHVKPQVPRGIKRALSAQSSPRKRLLIICSH